MEIYKIWKKGDLQKFKRKENVILTKEMKKWYRKNFRKEILMEMNINQDITFLYREGYCIW